MVPAPLMDIVAPLVQRIVPAWPQPSHQSWAGLPEGAESSERSDNELGDSQSEHIRGATRLDLVLALPEKVVVLTS